MEKQPTAAQTPNYRVKSIATVMKGSDVQARVFTLAPGDTIPWHFHQASADHYFVLEGLLTIMTRHPEEARTIEAEPTIGFYPAQFTSLPIVPRSTAGSCCFKASDNMTG